MIPPLLPPLEKKKTHTEEKKTDTQDIDTHNNIPPGPGQKIWIRYFTN